MNWFKRNANALKKWAAAGNAAVVIGAVTQTLPIETIQDPKFIAGLVVLQTLLPGLFAKPTLPGGPPTEDPPVPKVD